MRHSTEFSVSGKAHRSPLGLCVFVGAPPLECGLDFMTHLWFTEYVTSKIILSKTVAVMWGAMALYYALRSLASGESQRLQWEATLQRETHAWGVSRSSEHCPKSRERVQKQILTRLTLQRTAEPSNSLLPCWGWNPGKNHLFISPGVPDPQKWWDGECWLLAGVKPGALYYAAIAD